MNWVVIENTFVIIASSIPLLRPLFNIAKESAVNAYSQSSAYELGSRGGGTKNFTNAYANNTTKSVELVSSSEENIPPIQKAGRTNSILGSKPRDRSLEGGVIKKEVTYQVRYDKSDNNAATEGDWDPKSGILGRR
jgi:hypothetical protein